MMECLKKVQGLMEERDPVAIGILGQHTKTLTALVLWIGLLLEKKVVELLVDCGQFACFLGSFAEPQAVAIEHELFNFSAFILGAERSKLLHMLFRQRFSAANIIHHPRRGPDETKTEHSYE